MLSEEFKRRGLKIGRDKLFDLLRAESMLVPRKRKYVKTTDSRGWMRQYPNLVKGMLLERPEQLWVADITYLYVGKSYGYLHLITDAYSKRIMGYKLSDSMESSNTTQALQMALKHRQYSGALIHHSDRGLQYSSKEYTALLKTQGIRISMTQDGSPYDNAIAERLNGILKQEFGLEESFEDLKQTEDQVKEGVRLYNFRRPHLSNHYLTPYEMHQQSKLRPKTWENKSSVQYNYQ
jgi:transposase InsO family protein